MNYLGGKAKIARKVARHINVETCHGLPYWEPFVGGGSVIAEVFAHKRIGSDFVLPLILMYRALQQGWEPPGSLTREEYEALKARRDLEDPMTAFAGFGCSFGGKWFGGYARGKKGVDDPERYAGSARNSLLAWLPCVHDVMFYHRDYAECTPTGYVIYCDPPYGNTTGYGAAGKFDTKAFWGWVRATAQRNVVFVSEYTAPDDIPLVDQFDKTFSMDQVNATGSTKRVERLYRIGNLP
jgi:DNA adenine methylase